MSENIVLVLEPTHHPFEVPPPSEKIAGGFPQAGKKEGGLGEGIFARLLSAPKARQGWEAARSCSSRKTKPAKIDSLKEKIFCARPLKEKEIFAGFVRRQAASRWGGFLPFRAEIIAQKRFALRSVIATILLRPSPERFSWYGLRRNLGEAEWSQLLYAARTYFEKLTTEI